MIEPHYTKTYRASSPPANYTSWGRTVSDELEEAINPLICRELDSGHTLEAIMGLMIDAVTATAAIHKLKAFHHAFEKQKKGPSHKPSAEKHPDMPIKDIDEFFDEAPIDAINEGWEAEHNDPPE